MYERYYVYRITGENRREFVGSVSAASAEEAVYRLAGGEWGRIDYAAVREEDAEK